MVCSCDALTAILILLLIVVIISLGDRPHASNEARRGRKWARNRWTIRSIESQRDSVAAKPV